MLKANRNIKTKYLVAVVTVVILGITGGFALLYYSAVKTGIINPDFFWFDEPSFLFSIYGEKEGALIEPVAVDSAPDGTIYVADIGARDIKVFDSGGKFKFNFSSMTQQFPLMAPTGVAVSDDTVFVTDSIRNNIFKFDSAGAYKGILISPETKAQLTAVTPVGIEFINNKIYFTDILFHRVVVMDASGKIITIIGSAGGEEGQLAYPHDVAVGPDGKIYVSDSNNNRVQVSEDEQTFHLLGSGKEDREGSAFNSLTRGIAVDRDGYIWVVNTLTHQVKVLNQKGRTVYVLGEWGMEEEQFAYPNGIDIDIARRIYITDRINRRIQVYEQ